MDVSNHFSNKEMQMANKYMPIYSTPLVNDID